MKILYEIKSNRKHSIFFQIYDLNDEKFILSIEKIVNFENDFYKMNKNVEKALSNLNLSKFIPVFRNIINAVCTVTANNLKIQIVINRRYEFYYYIEEIKRK